MTDCEDRQYCPCCEELVSVYRRYADRFMRLHLDVECTKND